MLRKMWALVSLLRLFSFSCVCCFVRHDLSSAGLGQLSSGSNTSGDLVARYVPVLVFPGRPKYSDVEGESERIHNVTRERERS